MSFLLERGADKTLKTKDGRTPLQADDDLWGSPVVYRNSDAYPLQCSNDQVTKNAAVRALLGGEKRTAPEGPAEGQGPGGMLYRS